MKYKNSDLSRRLQHWLETSDKTEEMRSLMGVDRLVGVEVVVLHIAQPLHTRGIGKAPESPPGLRQYIRKLYANGRGFMLEQGSDPTDHLPYAYTTTMYDTQFICISEATARILLEPDAVGYRGTEDDLGEIRALLKHEFTHTQGNLQLVDDEVDDNGYIGELLEEYRAEVFSGFRFGGFYSDVYRAIEVMDGFKGTSIADIMRGLPCGGGRDKARFYGQLISAIGLTNTAKLAALQPEPYAQFQSCQSSRALYDMLKGSQMDSEIIATMTSQEIEAYLTRPVEGMTNQARQEARTWMLSVKHAAQS